MLLAELWMRVFFYIAKASIFQKRTKAYVITADSLIKQLVKILACPQRLESIGPVTKLGMMML